MAADASPRKELQTLKNREVWLTLGIAAIGFWRYLLRVYPYLAETLIQATQVEPFKILDHDGGIWYWRNIGHA